MNKSKFILVDDENAHNLICRINLQRVIKTAEVLSFTYPPDALDYLKSSSSDDLNQAVVLLDLNMPVMDGFEMLEEMNTFMYSSNKKGLDIFVLSSTINDDEVYQSMAHNLVKGFIEKPLTSDKISELFLDPPHYIPSTLYV